MDGMLEWHGEGLVLGRIPIIKHLHLREVAGIKGVHITGRLARNGDSHAYNTTGLNGWYAELS